MTNKPNMIEQYKYKGTNDYLSQIGIFKYLFCKRLNRDKSYFEKIPILEVKDISSTADNTRLEFLILWGGEEYLYDLKRSNAQYREDPKKIHDLEISIIKSIPESELGINPERLLNFDPYMICDKIDGWYYTLTSNPMLSYSTANQKDNVPSYADILMNHITQKISVPDNSYFNRHGFLSKFTLARIINKEKNKPMKNQLEQQF